jgi:hypothetical protein
MNNLVELIKNLPPLMKDQVLGETMESIKEDVRQEVIKEIRESAAIIVGDVTDELISAHNSGFGTKRPEYTKDLDDELYYTFLDISEQFVAKHAEKILFDDRRDDLDEYDEYDESDSSDSSY